MQNTIKAIVVGTIALLFTLIAFNNLTDFETNRIFIEKIMRLETVENSNIAYRIVENNHAHLIGYGIFIFGEILTAVLCWIGALKLLKGKKKIALIGLLTAFLVYMLGYVVIASEWFNMWQSEFSGGQVKAIMFSTLFLASMIFVNNDNAD